MKSLSYKCNFCGVTTDDPSQVIGLRWITMGNKLEKTQHPKDSENHLCNICVAALKELLSKEISSAYCAGGTLPGVSLDT